MRCILPIKNKFQLHNNYLEYLHKPIYLSDEIHFKYYGKHINFSYIINK